MFLLDESGSIGSAHFDQLKKKLLSDLVGSLDINSGHTRVGLVSFSTSVRTAFDLSEYASVASIQSAIRSLSYSAEGSTDSPAALAYVRTSMLTAASGARSTVPDVVVIFTDGQSTNQSATKVCAMLMLS